MKKLTLSFPIIFSFLFCFFLASSSANLSFAERKYYAKINQSEVYFYSQPIDSSDYQLFSIPESYFVLLLDNENQDFYYAQYDDLFGYVKKTQVVAMDGTPSMPYPTLYYRIFALDGMHMYSSPYLQEQYEVAYIPYLTESIIFYGYAKGDSIPGKSNLWYYSKLDNNEYGYVYSVFCDNLTILENTEVFSIIDNPDFTSANNPQSLSSVAMTFIIIGVSLPCIVVIYLLIKPSLITEKAPKPDKILKKKRHGDYYEFDESDLN